MMWSYKKALYIILGLFLLVSCQPNEPVRQGTLQINLCLPMPENFSPSIKRIIGDPGMTENFELPKYVYIVVMKQEGGVWSVWRRAEISLNEGAWEKTNYYGFNPTREDSIYRYTEPVQFLLDGETPQGRVYAICSRKKLTFSSSIGSIDTMEKLLNWQFNTAPDSIQESLQDIYSTPYNLTRGGDYYCVFDCSTGHIYRLDLILYHVAAKVDITWNVVDSMRINKDDPSEAVRLTKMKACKLFNGYAYCFKPMENSSDRPLDSGKEITIVQSTDEGLWWEGRSYFYTIPYTTTYKPGYYPLQMQMATNDSGDHNRTIYLQVDTSSPFVPWLRATFNIDNPLVAGTGDDITENF